MKFTKEELEKARDKRDELVDMIEYLSERGEDTSRYYESLEKLIIKYHLYDGATRDDF